MEEALNIYAVILFIYFEKHFYLCMVFKRFFCKLFFQTLKGFPPIIFMKSNMLQHGKFSSKF